MAEKTKEIAEREEKPKRKAYKKRNSEPDPPLSIPADNAEGTTYDDVVLVKLTEKEVNVVLNALNCYSRELQRVKGYVPVALRLFEAIDEIRGVFQAAKLRVKKE